MFDTIATILDFCDLGAGPQSWSLPLVYESCQYKTFLFYNLFIETTFTLVLGVQNIVFNKLAHFTKKESSWPQSLTQSTLNSRDDNCIYYQETHQVLAL